MIELAVHVEGELGTGPSPQEAMDGMAGAMASAIARVVRERGKRGDLAGQTGPRLERSPLWDGIEATTLGASAEVALRGSSEGRGGAMVPNELKARTVLQQHHVNVLALRDSEAEAIADGAAAVMARAIATRLPLTWTSAPPPAGSDLVSVFVAAMERGT